MTFRDWIAYLLGDFPHFLRKRPAPGALTWEQLQDVGRLILNEMAERGASVSDSFVVLHSVIHHLEGAVPLGYGWTPSRALALDVLKLLKTLAPGQEQLALAEAIKLRREILAGVTLMEVWTLWADHRIEPADLVTFVDQQNEPVEASDRREVKNA